MPLSPPIGGLNGNNSIGALVGLEWKAKSPSPGRRRPSGLYAAGGTGVQDREAAGRGDEIKNYVAT